ncbi:hypothetical protein HYX06_05830 [Candidatus Woesearchaeota archaeon]|nr:hypothetical protein [Candidatus Woesearchaeota archaeon]
MARKKINSFFFSKRGEEETPTTRHIAYWILIFASIIAMWFIVKGIISKLLTLY